MRAIRITEFGDADGLKEFDAPDPRVEAGQLLIRVEAIGVGGVDAVIRRGTLNSYGFAPGLIPGSEVAGRVISVGRGVDDRWVGRAVWAFTGVGGGYAELAVANTVDDVTPLPDGLPPVDSVALGSAGPVAHFGLQHGRLREGDSVLVRGASGSLGIMAVQFAAAARASVVAVTTSSASRGARLRELGATVVLDRSGAVHADSGFAESGGTEHDAGGADFDVIFDVVGGADLPRYIDRLAPGGRYVSVGIVGGNPPPDFGMRLVAGFQRSLTYSTFSLNTVNVAGRNAVRADVFAQAARGKIRGVVDAVLPLNAADEAHRRMDAGEVFGRFVLRP